MARILLSDLIALIKEHPDYYERWELDVPAEVALYIQFGSEPKGILESEILEGVSGLELVIDRDREGKVYGIELV